MNFKNTSSRKYLFVFLLPAFFLTGCGVWENFTTYFNLYYNTSDSFQQAEKAIFEQERELFSTDELVIPGTANQLLTKVIEKASRILQFHPNSSFVDDALLMLGKSFYYQKNYLKALRKFQELLATQPESDLIIETQLWIGKSQMRLNDYESAFTTLAAVRDTAIVEGEAEILKNAFVEEIVYEIQNENYNEAISASKEFIEALEDEEIIAEVYYELGKLYSEIDDTESAIASYRQVNNYSPSFQVQLRSNIELAKALRELDRAEEALAVLEAMGSENKFSDAFSEIDLETGVTLIKLKRYDEALDLLTYVDTSYAATPVSGIAKFKIAELYEYQFKNFDSAAVYYQKNISGNAPSEYIIASNSKTQRFKKYQYLLSTQAENEKKLAYLQNPDLFIQDSIRYYDTLLVQKQTADDLNNLGENVPEIDESRGEGGLDRKAPIQRTNIPQQTQVQLPPPPSRPAISEDSIKSVLVKTKFELANLFFTEFDLPDSAYHYYTDIIVNYEDSVYRARVLYGLASYYQTVNENVTADSIFNIIYDNYKEEQIVNAAAAKLNKPLIDLEYDPAKDLYTEAEKLLMDEKYKESLEEFYNIYKEYPQSGFAAKALYASGWILENHLMLFDSAAAVYDSIASQYPRSTYASAVKPKLDTYKFERENKRKAVQDSLNAIKIANDALNDSLGVQDSLDVPDEPVQTPLNDNVINQTREFDDIVPENQRGTPPDSLEQRHNTIIDSLRRQPGTLDSLQMDIEQTLDSLAPGKNENENVREP